MRLRTAILSGTLLVIFGAVAATLVAVKQVVESSAQRTARTASQRAPQVFDGFLVQRQTQSARAARVIADDMRLRALVNSDHSRDTLLEAAGEVYRATNLDIFVLIDGRGSLLVDMLAPEASGGHMLGNPLVKAVFDNGSAFGIWTDGERAYEVQAQRMRLGEQTVGAVVTGYAIDDQFAAAVQQQTGTTLAVLLDGALIAAAPLTDVTTPARTAVAAVLAAVAPDRGEPEEVEIGGSTFLAVGGRFAGYRGTMDLRYVLLRNLDRALAPVRQVTQILTAIVLLSVIAAVVLAIVEAHFLSRPLDLLVAFTARIAAGDLRVLTRAGGFAEVRALAASMNRMAGQLDESRRTLAEKERLENELRIASQIQMSIVPKQVALPGLEVAAQLVPADEVGGDYYDVVPTAQGGWLGIGDVSGHGLDAGLIMVMAQTAVTSLVTENPQAPPSQVLNNLNRVLYSNVKERLASDRHMTLSLIRYVTDGRLIVAGAHLDMLRLRVGAETCDYLATPGTWVALVDDVAAMTVDTTYHLEDGDLVVLYTDGLTEASNARGELLGLERVVEALMDARDQPVVSICERLLACAQNWAPVQEDDMTVLVMRYRRNTPPA